METSSENLWDVDALQQMSSGCSAARRETTDVRFAGLGLAPTRRTHLPQMSDMLA